MANDKAKQRQSRKKKGYYTSQRIRTTNNKIRRLRKRKDFDPTAEAAIKNLMVKS